MITDGQYNPNTPGATTLRDARPLYINGHRVTAEVYTFDGTQYVAVFLGTDISLQCPTPAEITNIPDLYTFIIASATTYANVKGAKTDTIPAQPSRKDTVVIDNSIVQNAAAYDIITTADFGAVDCVGCSMNVRAHLATHIRETYTPALTAGVAKIRASFTQAPVCDKFAAWHIAKHA